MRISELICKLSAVQETEGDILVCTTDDWGIDAVTDVDTVTIDLTDHFAEAQVRTAALIDGKICHLA